jgi:energy-coupling factor transporter ATP-binding protein EcfA2
MHLYEACAVPWSAAGRVALEIEIAGGVSGEFEVRANGERCWRGPECDRALEWCVWLVNNVAHERADSLVLHAGAAVVDGRGVLLTGPSGCGKSTLVTALALRGAAYMGDDTVAADGYRIRSNPKPMSIDDSSRRALQELDGTNAELHARSAILAPRAVGPVMRAGGMAAAALIVRPSYRAGAATSIAPLTTAEAAEILADQSFNFAARGAEALHAVASIARRCVAFVLEFSDVGEAADVVLRTAANYIGSEANDPPAFTRDGYDVELCDGEALIWVQRADELHHLSATATAVWRACEITEDAASVAAVITRRAATPEVIDDVRKCIGELRAKGLLPVSARRRPPMMAV